MKYVSRKLFVIILTTICLSTMIFSAYSILGAYKLNNNLNIQREHPFVVSEAAYKINEDNAISQIRINRLVMYNTKEDVTLVKGEIEKQYRKIINNLNIISERYLGDIKEVEELEDTLEELYNKELDFLEQAADLSDEEIEEYIKSELEPYYARIENITLVILDFAKGVTKKLAGESQTILIRSIIFSVLFFMLLVGISILLYREYSQKISASRAKSDFLSRMSHEIRTPLNAIIGMTTIAAAGIDEKERLEDSLSKILSASKHLLLLVNDILDMSKIESGKMVLQKETFNIAELLENVKAIAEEQSRTGALEFEVAMQSLNYEMLNGDSLRLQQVLLNILSNAIKYTQKGGKVKLEIQENRHSLDDTLTLCFIVSDNGRGMSEEFLEKLFTPFEQEGQDSHFRMGSTGIGMAITRNIVNMMGGTIEVKSTLGKGTSFAVEIPFEVADKEHKSAAEMISEVENQRVFSGKRFLVAEDNEINMEITVTLLESVGAKVEGAYDGNEACCRFQEADEGYYDLILMDVQMPGMNGYEATGKIRKLERQDAQTIPIIAMTANAFTEDVNNSLAAGMNDHLSKPIEIEIFYKTIRKYLK